MESVIREGTLRLLTSEASCDVILSCQGHRLKAHKLILSIASPMLRNLLLQDLSEPAMLIFPDISSRTMSLILDYIYTGGVIVYSNSLNEFISVATFLKLNIDKEFLNKLTSDCIKEQKVFEKKEENLSRNAHIYSKQILRKVPSLVPISSYIPNKTKEQRRGISCVIPSPWAPRCMPVLSDPRNHYTSITEKLGLQQITDKTDTNDANNNSQKRFLCGNAIPNSSAELDLSTSLNKLNNNKNTLPRASDLIIPCVKFKPPNIEDTETVNNKKIVWKTEQPDEKNSCDETEKPKPFKCEDCGKMFSQLRNYKYHRSVHEGTKEFAAKCSECGKVFNDRGYLSSHMKIHRDRKEYACPHCPKRFNQRVAYNMHLRIHTGVKPHECSTCGKSFSRKMLLKQHQRVHTGERPYSCPECGKTFADRSNMSLHARLHTGIKPYACTLCTKSFTKKHHLKTHMNFHTGLKPYTCQKCGLAFSQSSNMRTHYKKCVLKSDGNAMTALENTELDSN